MRSYFIPLLLLVGLVSACSQTKVPRTEAFLPSHEVKGASSSSFSLYFRGYKGATTALGQIFLPPDENNRFLIKAGFFNLRYLFGSNRVSDTMVKLRISRWQGDRPDPYTLWESDTVLLKKDFSRGWIYFDVPHIKLTPGRKYIAWLSLAGLKNSDDSYLSIVAMGPRTSTPPPKPGEPWQPNSWDADYPEGTRAFWRQENPDGLVENMTKLPWVVDADGHNLYFKMFFENRRP